MVLLTVYQKQQEMHRTRTMRIDYRIVNTHQPHVRPIVRGKENAKVEFGSKLQVSIEAGYTFIDSFSGRPLTKAGTCWHTWKSTKVGLAFIRQKYWPTKYTVQGKTEKS